MPSRGYNYNLLKLLPNTYYFRFRYTPRVKLPGPIPLENVPRKPVISFPVSTFFYKESESPSTSSEVRAIVTLEGKIPFLVYKDN